MDTGLSGVAGTVPDVAAAADGSAERVGGQSHSSRGPVKVEDLTDEELAMIIDAARNIGSESAENILACLLDGRYAAFRLSPGIVLCQVVSHGLAKELLVYWVTTKGLRGRYDAILAFLAAEARRLGCTRIAGLVADPRLVKLYLRKGARSLGHYLVREI